MHFEDHKSIKKGVKKNKKQAKLVTFTAATSDFKYHRLAP